MLLTAYSTRICCTSLSRVSAAGLRGISDLVSERPSKRSRVDHLGPPQEVFHKLLIRVRARIDSPHAVRECSPQPFPKRHGLCRAASPWRYRPPYRPPTPAKPKAKAASPAASVSL